MLIPLLALVVACGTDAAKAPAPEPAPAAPEAPAADPHAGMDHGTAAPAAADFKEAPAGAKVMFVAPTDGATVTSPVKVVMQVEGMEVKPAGELVEGTGHHHLLVDVDATEKGVAVPADEKHIHYGQGQTEAELALPPGEHTLTLQFADGLHRSYGEGVRQTIKVVVAEGTDTVAAGEGH